MVAAPGGAYGWTMNSNSSPVIVTSGLLAGAALLISLTGCSTEVSTRGPVYRERPPVYGHGTVVFEDDYDYYPGYEVYYSRNRREYVYLDGGQWVRRSEPRGVSINILMAAPSVRVDFRDAPERHHHNVVRSYPRNWRRPSSTVVVHTVGSFEDDYDYYPAHEVYYSRNRREYVYRDGDQWVRRSEPRGISVNTLLSFPSVRVDFRDAPELHHDNVVRSYPRNWHRQDDRDDRREDRKDDKQRKKERKDDEKDERKDRRR